MTTRAGSGRLDPAFVPLLLAVTLATFAAALYYRYGFGLTLDEPFMANTVRLPWRQLWALLPIDNLPFSYVLLRCWTTVFGESEIALRGLSSTAYALAVFCTGMAVRRVSGPAAGLAAAILLASSDRIGLEYAATARPYALLACFAAAALWQTVAITGSSNARTPKLMALFSTHLLGLLTHPTYLVVAVSLGVAAAVIETPHRRVLAAIPAAAASTYLIGWLPLVQATIALGTTRWMRPPTPGDLRRAVELIWGWRPALIIASALVISMGWRGVGRCRPIPDAARLVITGAAIAWVAAIGGSYVKPIFEASRTPMQLLPLTAAALALVLAGCDRAIVIVCVLVCLTAATFRVATRPRADPAPSARILADMLTRAQCGDVVVAPGVTATTAEYYFRRLHAPACINLVAFPSDPYDVFADWPGRLQNVRTRERLQREADATTRAAAQHHAVWILGLTSWETREASTMIDAAVQRVAACDPPVAVRGAFIDSVRRCTPKR